MLPDARAVTVENTDIKSQKDSSPKDAHKKKLKNIYEFIDSNPNPKCITDTKIVQVFL